MVYGSSGYILVPIVLSTFPQRLELWSLYTILEVGFYLSGTLRVYRVFTALKEW